MQTFGCFVKEAKLILSLLCTDKEKSPRDIEKERQILSEMLEIVEKRDRLVAQMDQLRIRWVHT